MGNLRSAFPEIDEKHLKDITRKYYRFLGDYFVETARMSRMSRDEIESRMRFENIEELDADLGAGKSVTLYLGHYCNWEWVSSLPLHFAPDTVCAQVYHHLHSRAMDEVFMKIRTRFDAPRLTE